MSNKKRIATVPSSTKLTIEDEHNVGAKLRYRTQSTLSDKEIRQLCNRTHYSKDQINQLHKLFYIYCPSGRLTHSTFSEIIRNIRSDVVITGPNAQTVSTILFNMYDADKNGIIDFSEMLFVMYTLLDAPANERMSFLFDVFDSSNKRKCLDREQLVQLAELSRHQIMHLDVSNLSKFVDDLLRQNKQSVKKGSLTKEQVISGFLGKAALSDYQRLNAQYCIKNIT
ncbi:hypothetical protein GJ496_007630 [Pomphorhynchus laevis]|nr:hypothetical protein GJ496_007630 [Pomphorhynchus laevis]